MAVEVGRDFSQCLFQHRVEHPLRYCGFSEDGSILVACGYSHTEVLDAKNGELLRQWPQGFPSMSRAVSLNSDTGRIASVDDSGALHVRELMSGLDAMTGEANPHHFYHRKLSYSPDGRWIGICSDEGKVELWQADTLQPVLRWQKPFPRACRISFSPESRYLIVSSDVGKTQVWRVVTGDEAPAVKEILSDMVAFRSDGSLMVAVLRNSAGLILLRFWDWSARNMLLELKSRHTIFRTCSEEIFFSSNGHKLAMLTAAHVLFWDAVMGRELGFVTGFCGVPTREACAFSPDGTRFIVGDSVGVIRIWDTDTGELRSLLSGHSHEISSISVSPDGRLFSSGDGDGVVRVWDLLRCDGICGIQGHTEAISGLAVSPLGNTLATGDYEGLVYVWDAQSGQECSKFQLENDLVQALGYRPDGRQLGVMGRKSLAVFEGDRKVFSLVPGSATEYLDVEVMAFSPDSRALAIGMIRHSDEITLRNTLDGGEITVSGVASVEQMQFISNENKLLVGLSAGILEEWDLADITRVALTTAPPAGNEMEPGSLRISQDGNNVVWRTVAGRLSFWTRQAGTLSEKEAEDGKPGIAPTFRPDGRYLALGEKKGRISLWSVPRRQKVGRLAAPSSVTALGYNSTGRILAAGLLDGSVAIWAESLSVLRRKIQGLEPQLPDKVALLPEPGEVIGGDGLRIEQVVFGGDDRWLCALNGYGKLRLWDLERQEEIALPPGLPDGRIGAVGTAKDWLAVATGTGVYWLDLQEFKAFEQIGVHEEQVRTIVFDSSGNWLLSADATEIKKWSVPGGMLLTSWACLNIGCIAIGPDACRVAAAKIARERVIELRDTGDYSLLRSHSAPENQLFKSLEFSPDGRFLRIVYDESGCETWDLGTGILQEWETGARLERASEGPWMLGAKSMIAISTWQWRTGASVRCTALPEFPTKAWNRTDTLSRDMTKAVVHRQGKEQVELWYVPDGRRIASLRHAAPIISVRFSSDGTKLVTGDESGIIKIWNAGDGSRQALIDCSSGRRRTDEGVGQAVLNATNTLLATGRQDGQILLWDWRLRQALLDLSGHIDTISTLEFSPDGRFLLSGDFAGVYKLWAIGAGAEIAELCPETRRGGRVFDAYDWLPDGEHLAFVDEGGVLRIVYLPTGRIITERAVKMWRPTGLKASPGGEYIALNGMGGGISMWDMEKSTVGFSCVDMEGPAKSRFSDSGDLVAIGDARGKIMIMKSADGYPLAQFEASSTIRRIAAFGDNDELMTAVTDTVKLTLAGWDPAQSVTLAETGPEPEQYAISPDGDWAVVSFESKPAKLWHVSTHEQITLPVQDKIKVLRFSPDGRYLATVCRGGGAWLQDTSSQRLIKLERPIEAKITDLVFVCEGRKVLGRTLRQTYLWETKTGAVEQVLRGEMNKPEWVSPNQRYIVLYDGSSDVMRVVDVESGVEVMQHSSVGLHVLVEWSRDSRLVCVGHDNRSPKWLCLGQCAQAKGDLSILDKSAALSL